ncbi:MAG: hypothetical protein H7124_14505 [Phycisphaerales bacterium]|nr:hypothetical protein [Hyphomonadaceae bacterium]
MLLLAIIVLTIAGVFRPSWRVFGLFIVFAASAQASVLAYGAGLFDPGVDYASPQAAVVYRDILRIVVLNTLVIATVGAVVVMLSKHFQDRDRRELELLASLTQQKPRNDS